MLLVSNEHTLSPTRLPIPMHVNTQYHNFIYSRIPPGEPSGSKHVEDIKKLKIKILI